MPGQLDSARLYTLDVVTLPLVAALMSVRSVTRLLLVSLGNFVRCQLLLLSFAKVALKFELTPDTEKDTDVSDGPLIDESL